MSRVGKQPIALPDKVKATVQENKVLIEGPLGRLERVLCPGIRCEVDAAKKLVLVKREGDGKQHRMFHGLERSLLAGMVIGVSKGYRKELEIIGLGYTAKLEGKHLTLALGYANTIKLDVPEGIKLEVLQPTNPGKLAVSGCDKQAVGEFAARIRAQRPPEPYQGKGIKYTTETIRRKAGKAFVGTSA